LALFTAFRFVVMEGMRKLTICLLGSFRAELEGETVRTFATDKVRALLAYLAVEAQSTHQREALADLLWPNYPEWRSRRNLNQALYSLRNTMGARSPSEQPLLLSTPETIRLNPAADIWSDVGEFTLLIDACNRHAHRSPDACEPCQERFQRAVALYQGDFLADLSVRDSAAFDEWCLACRERYRRLAQCALAGLASSYEVRGQIPQAIEAARRLADLDPYDDRAIQGLMRLLAACGKRGEALAVFEHFRRSLHADLGIQPDSDTQELYARLRLQRETEPASPVRYTNLPASLSPLIGREAELAGVQQCLLEAAGPGNSTSCRLLTILGPGGSGKSRLALEAARGLRDNFADGVYQVQISPLVSFQSFLPTLSSALQLHLQETRAPLPQVQDYLRNKELLLVLDGCETMLDGAPLFLELLHSAPDLKMLVTSRLRLNVEEEQVYRLGGLQYVSADDPAAAAQCAAVRLFTSAARRARLEFNLDSENIEAVAAICSEVQGLPLAILLAASWVGVLSPAEILDTMRHSLDFLQTEWSDLPARQRSMRLTFDYSWNMLETSDRRHFQGLCVFRSAFTRQAAEAVAETSVAELRRLVDKSLLIPLAGDWYDVHDLLRQYGLEKLQQDQPLSDLVHGRYSRYFLEKLSEWGPGLTDARQPETLSLMSAKINDLRSAWNLACEGADIERLSSALRGFCLYYEQSNRMAEGCSLCQETLASLTVSQAPSDRLFLARLHAWLTRFHRLLGEVDLAHQNLEEARSLLEGLAESSLDLRAAQALLHLEAAEQVFTSDIALARRCLETSLALYRSIGDAWRTAMVLTRLGTNYHYAGDFAFSDVLIHEALGIYQQLGMSIGVANTQRMLAQTMFRTGKADNAIALMSEVIQISQENGDKAQASLDMRVLGISLIFAGRFDQGVPLLKNALELAEVMGVLYEIAFINLIWGMAEMNCGMYTSAREHSLQSLELARNHGFQREEAGGLWTLGCIALVESAPEVARLFFRESIALYRRVGHQDELVWALSMNSVCSMVCADDREAPVIDEQALHSIREALEIVHSINSYPGVLFALAASALWLAQQGQQEIALEIYSLVARQPLFAGSSWFKEVFGKRILAHATSLDEVVAEAARQRGLQRSLPTSVAEMQRCLS
jgi:DNA-binding SARP family transcriptional activator